MSDDDKSLLISVLRVLNVQPVLLHVTWQRIDATLGDSTHRPSGGFGSALVQAFCPVEELYASIYLGRNQSKRVQLDPPEPEGSWNAVVKVASPTDAFLSDGKRKVACSCCSFVQLKVSRGSHGCKVIE